MGTILFCSNSIELVRNLVSDFVDYENANPQFHSFDANKLSCFLPFTLYRLDQGKGKG